jgi:hypothetical protein
VWIGHAGNVSRYRSPQFHNPGITRFHSWKICAFERSRLLLALVTTRVSRGTEREAQVHNRFVHHISLQRSEHNLFSAVRVLPQNSLRAEHSLRRTHRRSDATACT